MVTKIKRNCNDSIELKIKLFKMKVFLMISEQSKRVSVECLKWNLLSEIFPKLVIILA